jgi:hypothetical protein
MTDYLKVLTTELKSAQLIITILQELKYNVVEYNSVENIHTFMNPKFQVGQYTKGESASEWTEILKKKNHSNLQQKQTSRCENCTVKHTSSTYISSHNQVYFQLLTISNPRWRRVHMVPVIVL